MIADDARLLDAGACQLETWARRNADSSEYWVLPACNPWGNAELSFGGAFTRAEGRTRFSDNQVQAKMLFKPYEPGGWGMGAAVGTMRRLQRESARRWPGDAYFYVPVSFDAGNEDLVIHVNGGAAHLRDEHRTQPTWGLGAEVRVTPRLQFLPEAFATDRGRPFYQASVRYSISPALQVDASYGNRLAFETRDRWFSVGMHVQSPRWFP